MGIFNTKFLQYYTYKKTENTAFTRKRILDSYELEFYFTSLGYAYVNGEKYKHKKGMVLFARPGDIRQSENNFECFGIHFMCNNSEFIDKYMQNLPHVIYLPQSEKIFKELVHSRPTNLLSRELYQDSLLLHIFSLMHENYNVKPEGRSIIHPEIIFKINKITAYIKNNFKNKIDIDMLCKMIYMSRSGFYATFKAVTNMTPIDYINTVRVENAKKLLDTTDMSFIETALECGFNSQSYFNTIFKEKVKMTPTEYRKNLTI